MWRDPTANSFEPRHDVIPPVWAGRQQELADWERVVRPRRLVGQYERGRALLGEPAIGKSVLAARIAEAARAAGDIVVPSVRIPRGSDVLALLAQALTDTVHAHEFGAAVGDRFAGLLARVRAIARVELDAPPPPPNPHTHLRDLLIELGRHAASRGRVVLVHLDEVQNVTDEDALSQLLVALGDAIRHTQEQVDAAGTPHRRVLPVAVYVTGQSEFTDRAASLAGATFARRFKPLRLRHLSDADLREALTPFTSLAGWPITGRERGVAMTREAVDRILTCALGDPFLFQLVGKAAWDAAPESPTITRDHVEAGWAEVAAEARSHVERLLQRLPDREREFLGAMAALPSQRRTLTQISRQLGRTAAQLGSATQRLEERGIIERGRPYRFRRPHRRGTPQPPLALTRPPAGRTSTRRAPAGGGVVRAQPQPVVARSQTANHALIDLPRGDAEHRRLRLVHIGRIGIPPPAGRGRADSPALEPRHRRNRAVLPTLGEPLDFAPEPRSAQYETHGRTPRWRDVPMPIPLVRGAPHGSVATRAEHTLGGYSRHST